MGKEKITPEAFNEAAWNLGLPYHWKDLDGDGQREENEIFINRSHSFSDVFVSSGIENQTLKIIGQAATRQHLKAVRTPGYIQSLDNWIQYLKNSGAPDPEALRRALRKRDLAYRSWAYHTIDFTSLNKAEQKAAWILLHEVVPAVEAVHALQLDPNNLRYFGEIAETGNFVDYVHAWYSGGPWCQEVKDEACTSHPDGAPKRVPNAGHWPESFRQEEVAVLEAGAKQEPEKSLLSDFVYRILDKGKLQWKSLNAHPDYQPHLVKIIEGLKRAAAVPGIDPSLKNFFETRGGEFERTETPFPFFDGDVAWVATQGGLDVTLGFYESYESPFGHTGLMQALIGPVDREKEKLGKQFQGLVPDMERGVAEYLGRGYTPRDFSKGLPPLKFARLTSGGDARIKYVPAAYYLPNVPPHGDTSISKKVFIVNNTIARFLGVMKPMGDIVVHPSQRIITEEEVALWVIGHENAHGVGLDNEYTKALGPLNSPIEEAKGDLQGIASLPLAVQKGIITKETADRVCIVQLYAFLRALSYGMNDAHGIGAFIEFTSLYKDGAIVEKDGYYAVVPENDLFYKAAEKVARQIEKIQFESTIDGAKAKAELEAWLEESRRDMPERMKQYVNLLEKMPKDVFPWYGFKFSPEVTAEMVAQTYVR